MPRGRPRKATVRVEFRLPEIVFPLLITAHPELFKPGENPGEIGVFKHSALSNYLIDLIIKDCRHGARPIAKPHAPTPG